MRNATLTIALILASATSNIKTARAEGEATCEEKLSACDLALRAADSVIEQQQETIDFQNKLIDDLKTANVIREQEKSDMKTQLGAWYRNPFITVPITVIVTAIGTTIVLKK